MNHARIVVLYLLLGIQARGHVDDRIIARISLRQAGNRMLQLASGRLRRDQGYAGGRQRLRRSLGRGSR